MQCERFICILRIIGTTLFGVSLLLGITAAYIVGYQFIQTDNYYFSFGLYGAILALHLLIQSLFAYLEHRKMKRSLETPIKLNKSLALCIAAYQEDPDYLRKCLLSVKRLTYPGMKVIMVIDGNAEDDLYMMDIFSEIMGNDRSATYIWKNNFHEKGPGETEESHKESMQRVTQMVLNTRYVCIMQKWGGKREVMYTAFKALGLSVDYVQGSRLPLMSTEDLEPCSHGGPAVSFYDGKFCHGSFLCRKKGHTPFCGEGGISGRITRSRSLRQACCVNKVLSQTEPA